MIDRNRLLRGLRVERELFRSRNPESAAAYTASDHLFGRIPMTWMNKNAAGFPLYLASANGARVTDIDGHEYVDFCLGDTAAMAGHSPAPVVEAVGRQVARGITTMLPTTDAAWVGAELHRRFGLPQWSFALTATDANRWAIRLLRAISERPKVLFHSHCYHGSVDESLIVRDASGASVPRPGNVGAPCDVRLTSRVAEFNDLDQLAAELAHGDVAAVVMEPALTNVGIVLPEPGYLSGVRDLTRAHGSFLLIDETHTFSAGPGGATAFYGLDPDVITIGKAIAGGIPAGAYGLSAALAERLLQRSDLDLIDMGGVGGTLAGNALQMAAIRATLGEVLTDSAFEHMIVLATAFAGGVESVIDEYRLPWSVSQLGARVEYRFASPAPRTGGESAASADPELEDYLHVYLANRGILLTPFHNMALMCPASASDDVDRHTSVFRSAVDSLVD